MQGEREIQTDREGGREGGRERQRERLLLLKIFPSGKGVFGIIILKHAEE